MKRPTRSQARVFRALIARMEPQLQRAFLTAIVRIRGGVDWRRLNAALVERDVERAVAAIGIENGDFLELWTAAREAYIASARATVETLSISGVTAADAVGIRFDMTNPRAEAYLAVDAARMVQQVADDTRQAVRETILVGYQDGRGPRDIATDIAGRVVGGQRVGGVVGLDAQRARRLAIVAAAMRTAEGVRDLVIEHRDGALGIRYKVNAATERAILAAYRKGTAVPEATRIRSEDQYRNALLKARADTIAITETGMAVAAGKLEEWRQVLDKLGRSEADVEKTWQAGNAKEPRWWHKAANGMKVSGLNAPFQLANGAELRCAHDPAAPIGETARCHCMTSFRLKPRMEDLR